jgi:hypothetical protein
MKILTGLALLLALAVSAAGLVSPKSHGTEIKVAVNGDPSQWGY